MLRHLLRTLLGMTHTAEEFSCRKRHYAVQKKTLVIRGQEKNKVLTSIAPPIAKASSFVWNNRNACHDKGTKTLYIILYYPKHSNKVGWFQNWMIKSKQILVNDLISHSLSGSRPPLLCDSTRRHCLNTLYSVVPLNVLERSVNG